ncbi:unnamed protein product, partial [Sphacelaria rigidula]
SIQCWCGAAGTTFDVHGSATCNIPCAGDSSVMCGGLYAFNVYDVPIAPTPAPTTPAPTVEGLPSSLGCYRDTMEDRVMVWQSQSSSMTPDVSG